MKRELASPTGFYAGCKNWQFPWGFSTLELAQCIPLVYPDKKVLP